MMDQPELEKKVKKILLLEDYLIYRLSGVFATEQSLVCSTGYYNIVQHCYEKRYLALAGTDETILPEVFPCGIVVGRVTEEAAEKTCLKAGTAVVCTAMDQTTSAVGAGNVEPELVSETTGTCLTVAATTKELHFETGNTLQYYTHFDGNYLALAYNPTAAILMKWFKDSFLSDSAPYQKSGENPYQYMSRLAATVPVGCDGVLLLPHFAGKLMPTANEAMRGVFTGIGLDTTTGHFIRAIMEGVGFMLKENLELMQEAGIELRQIRLIGGGAKDRLWCQIKANILGCPVETMENEESTSLGAAILARKALDQSLCVPELCREFVRMHAKLTPEENEVKIYQQIYPNYLLLNQVMDSFYEITASKS